MEFYAARLRDTPLPSFTLGAFDWAELIGIATFIRDTQEKHRHKGHIYGVYVSAFHRGCGVGTALMKELIARASADPTLEQIQLSVTAGQEAALALYRKFGFELWGTEPQSLKVGKTHADQNHMVLHVSTRGISARSGRI